jgi:fermentation-respiration switch protein FrsA (DUF1100 family)
MARRMMMVLLLAAMAGLLLVVLVATFQRRLIYVPSGLPGSPAAVGLPQGREISVPTADGLTLSAWFVPSNAAEPGPAVLFLPGNGGNRALRAPLAAALSRARLSVLLLDYRGYGGNPGSPSESGLAADARAGLAALRRFPEVDPERILYFGESLGTGVAVTLATESPPVALILRSPYSSLTAVAGLHYPFLPVRWILRDRFESIARITDIGAPLLIVAGDSDGIVPASESRRLFDAASEPKRFILFPGAAHNDPALLDGAELLQEVQRFLEDMEIVPTPPPRRPLQN